MKNYLKINHQTYTEEDVRGMSLHDIGNLQTELEIEIESAKEALTRIGDDDSYVATHQKNCIRKKLNCMHYAQKWIASAKKEQYLDEFQNRKYNEKFVEIATATLPKFMLKKIEKAIKEAE